MVNGNEWRAVSGVERGGLVAFQTCFQHPIICVEMREPPSIILLQAFLFSKNFLNNSTGVFRQKWYFKQVIPVLYAVFTYFESCKTELVSSVVHSALYVER